MILFGIAPDVSKLTKDFDPRNAILATNPADKAVPVKLISNALSVAGLVIGIGAVLSLVYGGVLYITAGADENKSATGKRVIIYSVIAIVIVLLSYVIYNSILGGIAKGPEGI